MEIDILALCITLPASRHERYWDRDSNCGSDLLLSWRASATSI
jgi:hypothetical protein